MAVLHLHPGGDATVWRRALAPHLPDLDLRAWPDEVGDPAEIDVALAWKPPPGELAKYPNLKAVLSLGAGVDHIFNDPALPDGIAVGRLVDPGLVRDMVHYVTHWVLSFHRGFHRLADGEIRRRWKKFRYPPAGARRIGVMGLGELGAAAAKQLVSLDFDVAGWTRTPKPVAGVTGFHGRDGLMAFLGRSDIVVALLPHTPETENVLDADALAALPSGAFLINAGRGALVDEAALAAALRSGHIAAAALDVFREEPLPADHALWDCPTAFITGHSASLTSAEGAASLIAEDIRRALSGRPLLRPVDPARAY